MPAELTRRDFLKTGGIAGLAVAAGCYTQDTGNEGLVAPGGPDSPELLRIESNERYTLDAGSIGEYSGLLIEAGGQLVVEDDAALTLT